MLFADVVGSTRLYETFGDDQAKQMIDECLVALTAVVLQYGGRVVKTIGDEIMCVLPSADNGCLAATDMHQKIVALPMVSGVKRSVRIGFHYGAVIEENNDVFGDTVNLAARMAGLAKGMQIITTGTTVTGLSPMLQLSTRSIAALSIKGKGDEVDVREVIWQGGEELTMTTASIAVTTKPVTLYLEHGTQTWELDRDGIVIGRDAQCNIVIADRNASRQHARIERRRDKFFLVDQSTNGTFVAFANAPEVVLRREELMLRGSGRIGFGHSVELPDTETVAFTLRG
ncbi:MAG: adenylate/guanylate cyclase domain-containing protein [Burkholderiales bacterium]|nr:adenylate/guanylate cyclase domain-containing protein [Burkholderiales bacterium]MBK7312644.1 adenylate/guanylate cyclase domain-containing protein [Burkholderiales bacterium]MBL0243453.1 adenylate/guanylate cyclase domain-containing protein [Rhodoferax sp.]